MKRCKVLWMILGIGILLIACGHQNEAKNHFANGNNGPGNHEAKGVVFISAQGDHGDIAIEFDIDTKDGTRRNVELSYKGACAGASEWQPAMAEGPSAGLVPGRHKLIWWSYDQEAGCSGQVSFQLKTDHNETAESPDYLLDNTQPGANGFFEFELKEQGIDDEESAVFEKAKDALVNDPSVDFVATRRGDMYEAYSKRGMVRFSRVPTNKGYEYPIDSVEGTNPFERTDPEWIPTLADELAAGSNPMNTSYPDQGYEPGDPRLSFIEPENDSYPYVYERISAYFDHPDSANFMINIKSYSHAKSDLGEHGSISMVQSRSPFVFWGAGIRSGEYENHVRQADIAPTVAKLLGMPKTYGVDERGIWSHNVYLEWQDGHPIDDILTGEGSSRVILIVLDGLSHTELLDEVELRGDELPSINRLFAEGAWMKYGSITNWPSVTYPSHNLIGAGAYSGHHGLVDNKYWLRDKGKRADPIDQLVFTEHFFNPIGPVETLHETMHRNLGKWQEQTGKGAFTASLMDPSVKDADKADLEFRDRSGEVPFPPFGVQWPQGIAPPDAQAGMSAFFEELLGTIGMVEFYYLYTNGVSPAPIYTIFNFNPTDGCGHENGPHGDKMKSVLDNIDAQLTLMMDWLEAWGLSDSTTIVLTSDHGMQLGDINRSSNPMDTLDAAGIERAADTGLSVYFKSSKDGYSPDGSPTTESEGRSE